MDGLRKIFFSGLFILAAGAPAIGQGTIGILRCNFRGLDIHESRQPASPVIAFLPCGGRIMVIDNRFGSTHVRTADGDEGYIIDVNLGQWSFQPDRDTPVIQIAEPPPPRQAVRAEEHFRRFDIAYIALSYNRQASADLYGGDLSFTTNLNPVIGIAADVAVHETLNSPALRVTAYRFGPRFYGTPAGRFSSFAEVLAGGAQFTRKSGFSFAAGGGADIRLTSALTWRTQADYSFLNVADISSHGMRGGTGIAFRFGR